jgi:hypothetical protein
VRSPLGLPGDPGSACLRCVAGDFFTASAVGVFAGAAMLADDPDGDAADAAVVVALVAGPFLAATVLQNKRIREVHSSFLCSSLPSVLLFPVAHPPSLSL